MVFKDSVNFIYQSLIELKPPPSGLELYEEFDDRPKLAKEITKTKPQIRNNSDKTFDSDSYGTS